MQLEAQNLAKTALRKYKSMNKTHSEYRAAARLWGSGVNWTEALQIVNEAFDSCIQDES